METYDIVVIGGGPAGLVTATTSKKLHSDKSVMLIKESEKGLVPCGIPYVFHALGDIDKNVMGPKPLVDMGGEVLVDRVDQIDADARTVTVSSGQTLGFGRLVLATGSRPHVPGFLKANGFTKGIGHVPKSYEGIQRLKVQTDEAKAIIVLGSGFTAVELAEQLAQEPGKEVHLVYRAEHCLLRSFSPSTAAQVDEALRAAGVILHPRTQVAGFKGEGGTASGIRLEDGTELDADLVILGMGYKPNSELAANAGIQVNEQGGIVVDHYLRTSAEGVFAAGDCAACAGFITGRPRTVMLASTAAAEARILGHNLYSLRLRRNFPGTLSVFSTELAGRAFASAGVIESEARAAGIEVIIGEFADVDRHPGTLPDTCAIGARLIVSRGDGQIIGGELVGGKSVGEMVNTLALAIQKNVTVHELISFQLGTHPLLTTAPTKPILVKAAESALARL